MGDLSSYPRGRGSIITTAQWVKVLGITAAILALLFVVLHLTGRGLGGH
jgi:hypothetical protein